MTLAPLHEQTLGKSWLTRMADRAVFEDPLAGIAWPPSLPVGFGETSLNIQSNLVNLARPSPTSTMVGRPARSLEECLYDALAAFKIRTAAVAMHLDREWRSKLFVQFDNLLVAESWEEDDLPPNLASFSTFLRMITFLRPPRRPGLGATHDGHVVAAWTVADDRLTLECLPNDEVRWSLSRILKGRKERAAGITAVERLANVLHPYEPAKWFADANKAGT